MPAPLCPVKSVGCLRQDFYPPIGESSVLHLEGPNYSNGAVCIPDESSRTPAKVVLISEAESSQVNPGLAGTGKQVSGLT
jgi:hypothetical protein